MRLIALHLALFSALLVAYGQNLPPDAMPVSQVRPGMKGYGLTVFKGHTVERFDVEIIGVLHNTNVGRPLVLIKMSGGPITERGANIIQGMSGSPIYINGKCLGAVAYGLGFPKEPQGLVTPIEDMLEALDPRLESKPVSDIRLKSPIQIADQTISRIAIATVRPDDLANNVAWFRPLFTPLSVSGLSPRRLAELSTFLEPYGLKPMLGLGGTGAHVPTPVAPGSAVAGSLATGDVDLSAIGTLTYITGNKMVAFGHPFLGVGHIEMPLSAASIVDVYPTMSASAKMGNVAQRIGTIFNDRAFGVAGEFGRNPRTVKMTVTASDASTGRSARLVSEIAYHPQITNFFFSIIGAEALDRVRYGMENTTVRAKFKLTTDTIGAIERENVFFSNGGASVAFQEVGQLLSLLSTNPSYEVRPVSLEMEIEALSARNTAAIERISVEKAVYRPGETIKATIALRPFGGVSQTIVQTLELPKNLPNGRYSLLARGGSAPVMGGLPPGIMGGPPPQNLPQALARFKERERNDQMTLALMLNSSAINVDGVRWTHLPPLLSEIARNPTTSALSVEREEIKVAADTNYVMSGMAVVSIQVQKEDLTERPQRPAMQSPEGMPVPPPGEFGAQPPPTIMMDEEDFAAWPSPWSPYFQPPPTPVPPPAPPMEQPVSRRLNRWSPTNIETLGRGRFFGASINAEGVIAPGTEMTMLWERPEPNLYSIAVGRDGKPYLGGLGTLYRLEPERSIPVGTAPGQALLCMAVAQDGAIFVGTGPKGQIWRLDGANRFWMAHETGARYVNALLWANGSLYVATGSPARLLRVKDGQIEELARGDEGHFTSLATWGEDVAFGASDSGAVRLLRRGLVSTLFHTPEPNIMALAFDSKGSLYAGTHPRGMVYQYETSGRLTPLTPRPGPAVRSLWTDDQRIWAGSQSGIAFCNATGEPQWQFVSQPPNIETFAATPYLGKAIAITGAGIAMERNAREPIYESPVHDAKQAADWGKIEWRGGKGVEIQTRTGNTPLPDAEWSTWSRIYADPDGSVIESPDARYLQYRVRFTDRSATASNVSVAYIPRNQPPKIEWREPQERASVSGKATLRWQASDPDNDQLAFEAFYSTDDGKTWTRIENKPTATNDKPQTPPNALQRQIDQDPRMSPALRAEIMSDAGMSEPPPDSGRRASIAWDTEKLPDGAYRLKVSATDRPSVAVGFERVEKTLEKVIVCNAPPKIMASLIEIDAEGRAKVSGRAWQLIGDQPSDLAPIASVQFKVNNGDWYAAEALDRFFDSGSEAFEFTTDQLPKGKSTIAVKAFGASGKSATYEVKVER